MEYDKLRKIFVVLRACSIGLYATIFTLMFISAADNFVPILERLIGILAYIVISLLIVTMVVYNRYKGGIGIENLKSACFVLFASSWVTPRVLPETIKFDVCDIVAVWGYITFMLAVIYLILARKREGKKFSTVIYIF